MRGEHPHTVALSPWLAGSSPHAWGTLDPIDRRVLIIRFIPTCVGNTLISRYRDVHSPVHPHMRGEHREKYAYTLAYAGSSPHAWGTLTDDKAAIQAARFIPTCVGNTATCRIAMSILAV